MKLTINSLLQQGTERLKEAGIENADWDAWCLLEYVTGISRAAYLCDREKTCKEEQIKQYLELIEKRMIHIPLQYLTGEQVFMGLPFLVNSYVLIPRQDTEILVEEVKKCLMPGKKILDMCTGSGCILLSLVYFCAPLKAVGADLSEEALNVAKKNEERLYQDGFLKRNKNQMLQEQKQEQEKQIGGKPNAAWSNLKIKETEESENGIKIEWICTDMFAQIEEKFDCIVSNPPYIATSVIDTLAEEVKQYEPFCALDGREDGLFFYRILAKEAGNYLNSGGMLYLEIGYDQGEAVSALLKEYGFLEVQIKKDLSGRNRVCFGIWK